MTNYKLIAFFIAIVALAGATAGCRSTKNLRKVIAAPAIHSDTTGNAAKAAVATVRDAHADSMAVIHTALAAIAHNHIDFQTFSGVMHVHYQGSNGEDNEVNAVVKIQKDKIGRAHV